MVSQFKAILPKIPAPAKVNRAKLMAGAKEFCELIVKPQFDETVGGWQGEKPIWIIQVSTNQYGIFANVKPKNPEAKGAKKWIYLDKGTPAHEIRPKKPGGVLAFNKNFQPGSKPGVRGTIPNTSSPPVVFSKKVMHPGIEARGWTELIKDNSSNAYPRFMQDILDEIAASLA